MRRALVSLPGPLLGITAGEPLDLRALAGHGLTVTRTCLDGRERAPTPDPVDEAALERFGKFLDRHTSAGLRTVLTLRLDASADVRLVGRQARLAARVARRFAGHRAVAAWLVVAPGATAAWAQLVIQGLRAGGATQPVSVDEVPALADWVRPRVYPAGDNRIREHLRAAFRCELAAGSGKPVVLEFGGGSGSHHCRQVLHNSLLGGAGGWLAGLDQVAPHRCARAPTDVGIVVPSYLDTPGPAVEEAYVAWRGAGTPPGLIRDGDRIPGDCLLYALPSTRQLTTAGWRRLGALAHAGATVYVSSFDGAVDRLCGVRHQLRYGLVDPVGAEVLRLTLRDDLGNLTAGTELRFPAGGDPARRGYLPVEPVEARVLATDQADRPALLHRTVGAGAVILCCYPLEAMAGAGDTWRLYTALAHAAGAHPVVRVDEPRVLADCLDRDDGTRFVWLVSQAPAPVTVTPRTHTGTPLCDLRSGTRMSTVELPPFGVRVLRAC
jgi:hypothetical protein